MQSTGREYLLLVAAATLVLLIIQFCDVGYAKTRYFNFTLQYTNVTRLCRTKAVVTVNGEFPGPASYVREGDKVVVNVTNLVTYNATIHWHGVRQLRSAWADGPAYITQCPIQTGQSYIHRFQIIDQRGTLFWHAHYSWLRATVHGAFIILKKNKTPYPFPKPHRELPLLLGEWWNVNVEDVISQSLATGGAAKRSDALMINGQPGDLYDCSRSGTVVYNVSQGETVMLRIINAAVNLHVYFAIANHSLTVVEADAGYTEPYTTDVILLSPGQTTNVLLTANNSVGQYYIAAAVYSPPDPVKLPVPTTPTTAILSYNGSTSSSSPLALPTFPLPNDTAYVYNFYSSLKGRNHSGGYYNYPDVLNRVDVDLLHTISYNLQPCPSGRTCLGPNNTIFRNSINNITFVEPTVALLQAYFNGMSNGVYTTDFPDVPPFQYNYTGVDPVNRAGLPGTRVKVIPFNSTVQVVYQDTATLFFQDHPIHLHGQDFYVVGTGVGTYDPNTDPASFNLLNPPTRNTVSVPAGGWAAIRFQAINPGVWFVHCHIDLHLSWGMDMAFIVLNGVNADETLPPPPADLPAC